MTAMPRRRPAKRSRRAWSWFMAAWLRMLVRSWKWSPRNTCSGPKPNGKGGKHALGILEEILAALRASDMRAIGAVTTRNFFQPIQTIIPWASNAYTETLIDRVRRQFGDQFWGFWMLGGMSGGGMGFIVAPEIRAAAQEHLQSLMSAAKKELQHALPFAMEPVVYDFAINERGTVADQLQGPAALHAPGLLRADRPPVAPA